MVGNIPFGNVPPLGVNPPSSPFQASWWRARNIIFVLGLVHDLPRHSKKYTTKFDLERKESAEEHLLRYTIALEALQVQHEDVSSNLFSYSLEGKSSSLFFNLVVGSITSWDQLERLVLTKYDINKMPTMIVQELSSIKMNQKETISDFDQRFLALLNKLPVTSRSTNEILFGFYHSTLPIGVRVFVIKKYLHTLDENFDAAKKIKQGMISLGKSINGDNSKPSRGQEKKNVLK